MSMYNHTEIEKKWQKRWKDAGVFRADNASKKPKFYALMEFPYPSGAGLHVGHVRGYTAMDIIARKRRMDGYSVLYPIGWDAFGLPTENYAIKTERRPADVTAENIAIFKQQMKAIGLSFDWDREVNTTDPTYYKWTQWMFLEFFKAGLAYKKAMPINWCVSCKIGLANEEVVGGACERCGGVVEKRDKEQWMIAITKYAERLINDLATVDYLEKIKKQQIDWIGRSEGAVVKFYIKETSEQIPVFTTRIDTIYSGTFLVLAPEHEYIDLWRSLIANWDEVASYRAATASIPDIERTSADRERTGVGLKGITALNPATGEEMPVWISDFVLAHYGTGAVFADAHDQRDFDLAKKYNLPLKTSLVPPDPSIKEAVERLEICFEGEGTLVRSGEFDGMISAQAREKITAHLSEQGLAEAQTTYKLRDWVFSRQRYWGEPIPLVWCDACAKTDHARKEAVHIFHGWFDSAESGFIPALKSNLEQKGYDVVAVDAPNTEAPVFDEWLAFGEAQLAKTHSTPTLVGHSMGAHLALKLAETHKVKRLVAVAPVGMQPSDVYFAQFKTKLSKKELAIFRAYQDHGMDVEAIKRNVGELIFVFSNNDPWITSEIVEQYKAAFGDVARFIFVEEMGHMSHDSGCRRVPFVEALFDRVRADGWIPVPEDQLPIELPDVERYEPTDSGESPLAAIDAWVKTTCPECGSLARRETDTMPNWAGSSWYFLRYADAQNDKAFASKKVLAHWMPVDWYNGGMEHTTLHLLYSRFWNKFLYDRGYVLTSEPYAKRTSHGLILAEDGSKMSKSKGNVVNPNDIIASHGADTLRLYEMFIGPFDQPVPWSEQGVVGVYKFLKRVFELSHHIVECEAPTVIKMLHKTIKKVTEDIEAMRFNTAIAQMMTFVNTVYDEGGLTAASLLEFLLVLSPFAPHIVEEMYEKHGQGLAMTQAWPSFDIALVQDKTVTIGVQVNGKVRADVTIAADASSKEARKAALAEPNVVKHLEGKEIKKFVYVQGRIINIVVDS
ncbi:hypothetical protein A3C17_03550 [Candidatus Uhrbacteria bacterium RIFCSPHIGHO2_02_FULL_53_13]|uniref:Leucine--tRNA ligase n=1 Tax=Candidatus Uhrbacteria bacterium RIFCSPHIGHO2_02_FULL_53_13 TaxID=1802389 RepID=A0A1F7TZJ9_9BACT|nr:MAG: hypothetical protein A3C17_03550 [Candidatus Uhrbacteria bacterium RIFCSPHIGHO2_02_FULL_53_13]